MGSNDAPENWLQSVLKVSLVLELFILETYKKKIEIYN